MRLIATVDVRHHGKRQWVADAPNVIVSKAVGMYYPGIVDLRRELGLTAPASGTTCAYSFVTTGCGCCRWPAWSNVKSGSLDVGL